jgi:hypothetical protein
MFFISSVKIKSNWTIKKAASSQFLCAFITDKRQRYDDVIQNIMFINKHVSPGVEVIICRTDISDADYFLLRLRSPD